MADAVDVAAGVVLALGAAIWVGGLVAAVVMVRAAREALAVAQRVRFFQALGRRYLAVLGTAFAVAVAAGAWLLRERPWDATMAALTLSVGAVAVVTVAGVVQARAMTRLRRRAVEAPEDPGLSRRVSAGARRAVVLRAVIGALTVLAVVLGVVLVAQ